jgi:hypothetical protein
MSRFSKDVGAPKDQPASFELLWDQLFYELYNSQNDKGFLDLYTNALKGAYSESEFVEYNTRLEYLAGTKINSFYRNVFLPWAKANNFKSDPAIWNCFDYPNYEKWIGQFTDPKGYPWDYWGHYYETVVVANLKYYKIPIPKRVSSVVPNSASVEGRASPADPTPGK